MKLWLDKEDEEDISEYPAIKWGNQHEQDGADKYNSIYMANKTAILDQIPVNYLNLSFITFHSNSCSSF